jgi:hypothetical protein
MVRVRLFSDWEDSYTLTWRLAHQTTGMSFCGGSATKVYATFKDIEFVWDESYTHAVVFNFPTMDLKSPKNNNVALLLEPPEIIDTMFADLKSRQYDNVREIFSFVPDRGYSAAPGLGYATASGHQKYPSLLDKRKKLCMIVSDKLMTPWHQRRQSIKEALLASKIDMDFYGRNLKGKDSRIKGEIPSMCKADVIQDYEFVMDLENSHGAVTDKYFDPILCNSIPVTNAKILDLLAPSSFVYIDFNKTNDQIVADVAAILDKKPLYWVEPVAVAKNEIMNGSMSLAHWIWDQVTF